MVFARIIIGLTPKKYHTLSACKGWIFYQDAMFELLTIAVEIILALRGMYFAYLTLHSSSRRYTQSISYTIKISSYSGLYA
jgi:hypothetical protein